MALGTQLRDLVDSFSDLTAQHLRLARVELASDAKFIGLRVGVIAALAPMIFVGYGFVCIALAYALQRVIALDLSFFLVGLLNLALGGTGIYAAVKQLQSRPVLDETLSELDATTTLVRRGPEP